MLQARYLQLGWPFGSVVECQTSDLGSMVRGPGVYIFRLRFRLVSFTTLAPDANDPEVWAM